MWTRLAFSICFLVAVFDAQREYCLKDEALDMFNETWDVEGCEEVPAGKELDNCWAKAHGMIDDDGVNVQGMKNFFKQFFIPEKVVLIDPLYDVCEWSEIDSSESDYDQAVNILACVVKKIKMIGLCEEGTNDRRFF